MATDFGLLVSRYNTAAPALTSDGTLRELRIDAAGRVMNRAADGNDNTLSYFADNDAVGSGVGNFGGTAGDRGFLALGKDSIDNIYRVLRVNNDGSLIVSLNSGVDASVAADSANAAQTGGEVALTVGTYALVQSVPFATGHFHVSGWSYASDKNTMFQLAIAVHSGVGSPVRADLTEILDSQITSSARPSDHINFTRQLDRVGAANTYLCVFAKQLQQGSAGIGASMVNVDTTT